MGVGGGERFKAFDKRGLLAERDHPVDGVDLGLAPAMKLFRERREHRLAFASPDTASVIVTGLAPPSARTSRI